MNTRTLTAVILAGLLVTSGIAFATPVGATDSNADANGGVDADAGETDRERDGRTDDGTAANGGTADSDSGGVSRLGVVVSAVVGSDTGSEGDVHVDGEVEAGADGASDDGTDSRESAADRVRSIHDRVRAFLSDTFDGDLGVRVGIDVFAGDR